MLGGGPAGPVLHVVQLGGLLLEVALGGQQPPAELGEVLGGAVARDHRLGHPLLGLVEELAGGALGVAQSVHVARFEPLQRRAELREGRALRHRLALVVGGLAAEVADGPGELPPFGLELGRGAIADDEAGLDALVVRSELAQRRLELVDLGVGLVERVLLLPQVEGAAFELPLGLGDVLERAVLLLVEVPERVALEPRDLLQGARQPVDRRDQLAHARVDLAHLVALLLELVLEVEDLVAEALRRLVFVPQVRLRTGDAGDDGLPRLATAGVVHELVQRRRGDVPGVALAREALGRRRRLGDLVGVLQEAVDEATQALRVARSDGPARAVLEQVRGDHLLGRGDDREPAAEVVDLPEGQVDLPLRVRRHEIEGDRRVAVVVPQLVHGDHAAEVEPLMIPGQRVARIGVLVRVRAQPVLAAVQLDAALPLGVQDRQQRPEPLGHVGPRPEDAPRHEHRVPGLLKGRLVGRTRDRHDVARAPRAVDTREGEQRQVEVLLPGVAVDEVVGALEGVEHPHRLTLVRAVLELLLEDPRSERVEDHGEPSVGEAAGLFEGLHQDHVRVDLGDDVLELVGLGEAERVAGGPRRAAGGCEPDARGPAGPPKRRGLRGRGGAPVLRPVDRAQRVVAASLLGGGPDRHVQGHPRLGGVARRGLVARERESHRVPVAALLGLLAQGRREVLGAGAVVDVVPAHAEPFAVRERALPRADR